MLSVAWSPRGRLAGCVARRTSRFSLHVLIRRNACRIARAAPSDPQYARPAHLSARRPADRPTRRVQQEPRRACAHDRTRRAGRRRVDRRGRMVMRPSDPEITRQSDTMSLDLLKRGFKFVGSIICYAVMRNHRHGQRSPGHLVTACRSRWHNAPKSTETNCIVSRLQCILVATESVERSLMSDISE